MKRLFIFLGLCFTVWHSHADNLLNYVEYKVPTQNLLALSSQGVRIRICDTCPIKDLSVTNNAVFLERNNEITLKQATELFVRNPYDFVSVFVNRSANLTDRIVFGGFDELSLPIHSSTPVQP